MATNNATLDCWCIVELFGHARIAGKCTEQSIAGANMLRVDVPETEKQPAFTRFFGNAAIYAINPVDEQTARTVAVGLDKQPVQIWELRSMLDKQKQLPSSDEAATYGGDFDPSEDY